jgi:hypothetical protein
MTTPLPAAPLDGLNPFSGRHDAAVRAGLGYLSSGPHDLASAAQGR